MKNAEKVIIMKSWLADRTRKLRHRLMKILSPKMYSRCEDIPRPTILEVLEKFGKQPLVGAEIGVGMGNNAKSILKLLNMSCFYLIDPFLYPVQSHFRKFSNVTLIRKTSREAIMEVPELDFCYIDGNHSYANVYLDLAQYYYWKLKPGGIIGGHDFTADFIGVCKAVMTFADLGELELHTAVNDWWFVKPEC